MGIVGESKQNRIIKNAIIFLARYFHFFIFGIIIVILLFGYFLIINPKIQELTEKDKALSEVIFDDKGPEFKERQDRLKELKKILADYEEINPDNIKKIKTMLPTKKRQEILLAEMEKIVLENGFLLESITVGEVKGEVMGKKASGAEESISASDILKDVKKLKITMGIIGADYNGLKNILGIMENNLRLLDVTKVSLNSDKETVSLEAYTYYLE
jgi:hypothetical protein